MQHPKLPILGNLSLDRHRNSADAVHRLTRESSVSFPLKKLESFYKSNLGSVVRSCLKDPLHASLLGLPPHAMILGSGYTAPYEASLTHVHQRGYFFLPVGQETTAPKKSRPHNTIWGDEIHLPFYDTCFDAILLIHHLEFATHPALLMRELWRILGPEGRLILVVPNRRGFWSHFDHTPFGQGQTYTQAQICQLLTDTCFVVENTDSALFIPPFNHRLWPTTVSKKIEKVGSFLCPKQGGVWLITATKHGYWRSPFIPTTSSPKITPQETTP